MGRSIVSKQEARVCDLENKLEFQRGQVKRFEVRAVHHWPSARRTARRAAPLGVNADFFSLIRLAGAGAASARQRGPPG